MQKKKVDLAPDNQTQPLGEAASRRFNDNPAQPLGEAASRRFNDNPTQPLGEAASRRFKNEPTLPLWKGWLYLFLGLAFLVGSSHVLVWGCVDLARTMGVSELLIGLTVVALGTSLPELASAIASARKGEHEFVLGNIVGSNFFNTLAVVGLAGTISPFKDVSSYLLTRDLPMMLLMSVLIAVFGLNYRKPREPKAIGRVAGALWLLFFVAYMALMIFQETTSKG